MSNILMRERNLISLCIILILFIIFFSNFISAAFLEENTTWEQNISALDAYISIAFGDLDNDNDLDMIQVGCGSGSIYSCSTAGKSSVYINNGTSLVENQIWEQNLTATTQGRIGLGDIDNDGDLDLILIHTYTEIYENNGTSFIENSTWENYITGSNGAASGSVNLGDIDNDGDLDIVMMDMGSATKSVWINNGTTFINDSIWSQDAIESTLVSSVLVDIDNDNDLDSLVSGYGNGPIYINNGTTFELSSIWSAVRGDHISIAVGDVNDDGDLDMFGMRESGACGSADIFFENNGSELVRNTTYETDIIGLYYGSAMFGDYNNDGYLDLVTNGQCGGTPYSYIYNGSSSGFELSDENIGGSQIGSIVFADLNNDNNLDLINIRRGEIYINNISTPNTAPTSPNGFSNYYSNRKINLGWLNGSDAETPSTGLYYNLMLGDSSSNNHSIISGVYGGQGDVSGGGGTAFGYFGNMMQRKNFTLKVDRLEPSTNYTWYVQTIDTALKAGEWSALQSFVTPADMERPNITLNSPVDNFNSSSFILEFNATVSDNQNLSNVSLFGNWTGDFILNSTNVSGLNNTEYIFNVNLTGYSDGFYIWMIQAEDNASNVINSSIRTFMLDTSAPDINITFPLNKTNSSSNILDVNYSVSDLNLGSCWYSNDSMDVNTTLASCANITGINWSEGEHNVTVWANDSFGNLNWSSVTFAVETIIPDVLILSPSNNTNTTNTLLDVNYSVSDLHLESCWYSNDTMSLNTTLASCANITSAVWSEGKHNVTIWANDSFGNLNYSTITFSVDTEYPVVGLVSPANLSTWTDSATVTFTYNVSDVAIVNCSLIINNVVDQTDGAVAVNVSQTFEKTLSNGDYYWSVNCTDYIDYSNISEVRNLTVVYTPSSSTSSGGGSSGGGSSGGGSSSGGSTTTTTTTESSEESFWTETESISNEDFEKGVEKSLGVKKRLQVTISNEEHYVGVVEVNEELGTAVINISSTPQQATLSIGELKKFEVNDDDYYDLSVKLNSIENSVANFTILSISEKIPSVEEKNIFDIIKEKGWWRWIFIGLGIVVLGVVFYFIIEMKNKRIFNKVREQWRK